MCASWCVGCGWRRVVGGPRVRMQCQMFGSSKDKQTKKTPSFSFLPAPNPVIIITIIIWGDPAPRRPSPSAHPYQIVWCMRGRLVGWFQNNCHPPASHTHAGTTHTHTLTLTPLHSHDPLGTARCATPVGKWDDAGIFRRLQDLALRPPHKLIVMRLSIGAALALCP